ncbi:MAG: ribonuclease P protein component [Halorhodospira sp.]
MAAGAAFPRTVRLLKRDEFEGALRAPDWRSANRYFRISARHNEAGHARLGLAVPKRRVRRATGRNRLKRIIRESFRVRQRELPAWDFVVGIRSAAGEADNATLFLALDELWQRARGWPCDGSWSG